jgi:signal transduction histidine kinase
MLGLRAGWNEGDEKGRTDAAEAEGSSRDAALELLLTACHDVTTPLAGIQLHVEGLLRRLRRGEELPRDKVIAALERVRGLARDCSGLVSDVLAVDRAAPAHVPVGKLVDAEQVLASAVALHGEALQQAGCTIVVIRDRELGSVVGPWEPRLLQSVFGNLLQNVSRHAAGAAVAIRFSKIEGRLRVRFCDDGPGLPSGMTWASGPGAGRPSRGRGLGTWIVRQAVARLGGEIAALETGQQGLSLELFLPLKRLA